jgi:hypothetical protein
MLQKFYRFVSLTVKKLPNLLKGVHPIIFVSNIFPNSHLIQKCIQNQQVDCTLVILAIKLVSKILAGILYYFKLKYYNLMWTFPGCRSFADPTQRHINQYRKYHNLELTCENVWLTFQAHFGQSISEVSYIVLQPLHLCEIYFSNFSCMFLNPNNFFQFKF